MLRASALGILHMVASSQRWLCWRRPVHAGDPLDLGADEGADGGDCYERRERRDHRQGAPHPQLTFLASFPSPANA